ncbi:MAG: helix-turn-helix domain-containing protein [Candidatus Methylomirabilales bacterium]
MESRRDANCNSFGSHTALPPSRSSTIAAAARLAKIALRAWQGTRSQASHCLGITRVTLRAKIRRYGLA